MRWLLVLILVGCEATATPPTVAPTPPKTPKTPENVMPLDPESVAISFATHRGVSETAAEVRELLPRAWSVATGGRSELIVIESSAGFAPIHVHFIDLSVPGAEGMHRTVAGRIHLIDVYDAKDPLGTVLHELGHALGCCVGPESDGHHWLECRDEIMCHDGTAYRVFSDRELAQMGLR